MPAAALVVRATLPRVALVSFALAVGAYGLSLDARQGMEGAVIDGIVLEAGSRLPVAGATVVASPGAHRVVSDSRGRFSLNAIREPVVHLAVSAVGYSSASYGQRFPGDADTPFQMLGAQRLTDVILRLWKAASVEGSVLDEFGDAFVNAPVFALKDTLTATGQKFVIDRSVNTDDRGRYRFGDLVPGRYVFAVPSAQVNPLVPSVVRPGRTDSYRTVYYPDSPTLTGAAVVSLDSGESRYSLDFHEAASVTARSVSGTLAGVSSPAAVRLAPSDSRSDSPLDVLSALTDDDGRFTFPVVTPGSYELHALVFPKGKVGLPNSLRRVGVVNGRASMAFTGSLLDPLPPTSSDPTLWAEIPLAVPSDGEGAVQIAVPLQTGRAIRGAIAFDGTAERPSTSVLLSTGVVVRPADGRDMGGFAPSRIEEDLTFRTPGIPPGRYLISFMPVLRGWHLKSIMGAGLELRDLGVEVNGVEDAQIKVAVTDSLARLSGTAIDDSRIPPEASVYLFTSDRSLWNTNGLYNDRFREVRPPRDGSFAFNDLPGGEYFLAAVVLKRPELWRNRESLAYLAGVAERITLGDRQNASRSIRLRYQ